MLQRFLVIFIFFASHTGMVSVFSNSLQKGVERGVNWDQISGFGVSVMSENDVNLPVAVGFQF